MAAMEEEDPNPSELNSVNQGLESTIVYLSKKRKLQVELSGLPLPKHKCWDRSFTSGNDFLSNENPRIGDFGVHIIKGKTVAVPKDDESEIDSAADSNSFGGDSDSAMSSAKAKIQSEYPKTHPSDRPSTSSANWDNSSFKNNLYSLDSRLVSKSGPSRVQSSYIGGDYTFPHNDFGLNTCLTFDDHLLEFGSHIDYSCMEHENDNAEICSNKELEDMLYSDEMPPSNYVLSSGRWSVNQETQTTAKKLTIDKEFEQYFSMLML